MLIDNKIKAAKLDSNRQYKLYDRDALFVLIFPNGTKLFQIRYQFARRRRDLSLGKYPSISLKQARDKAYEYRCLLGQGVDAYPKHKAKRRTEGYTVRDAVNDLMEYKKPDCGEEHWAKCWSRFNNHVLPRFGDRLLTDVVADEWRDLIVSIDRADL